MKMKMRSKLLINRHSTDKRIEQHLIDLTKDTSLSLDERECIEEISLKMRKSPFYATKGALYALFNP